MYCCVEGTMMAIENGAVDNRSCKEKYSVLTRYRLRRLSINEKHHIDGVVVEVSWMAPIVYMGWRQIHTGDLCYNEVSPTGCS